MSKSLTTEAAFLKMINTRGTYKSLGLSAYTVRRMRLDLKHGKSAPSLERKIELLKAAGWAIEQEMKWSAPD